MTDLRQAAQQALEALESGLAFPTHSDVLQNLRTALAEPEQSFEDEQRVINADNHRRANALEEAIHAAWSAGYVEGEKAVLEQQAEPVAWMTHSHDLLPLFHRTERAALVWAAEPTPLYTAPPQRKPLTDEQADQIISGLQTCHHQSSKREFLKVWLRDWAAHGIKEGA